MGMTLTEMADIEVKARLWDHLKKIISATANISPDPYDESRERINFYFGGDVHKKILELMNILEEDNLGK